MSSLTILRQLLSVTLLISVPHVFCFQTQPNLECLIYSWFPIILGLPVFIAYFNGEHDEMDYEIILSNYDNRAAESGHDDVTRQVLNAFEHFSSFARI